MFLYQKYLFLSGIFFCLITEKILFTEKVVLERLPKEGILWGPRRPKKTWNLVPLFLRMAPPSEQEIASMVSSNGRRLDCHRISCPCQRLSEQARFSINRAAAQEGHGRRFCHHVWLIDHVGNFCVFQQLLNDQVLKPEFKLIVSIDQKFCFTLIVTQLFWWQYIFLKQLPFHTFVHLL